MPNPATSTGQGETMSMQEKTTRHARKLMADGPVAGLRSCCSLDSLISLTSAFATGAAGQREAGQTSTHERLLKPLYEYLSLERISMHVAVLSPTACTSAQRPKRRSTVSSQHTLIPWLLVARFAAFGHRSTRAAQFNLKVFPTKEKEQPRTPYFESLCES